MKNGLLAVANFGLTSGIITTLGLIVGLNSGTHSVSVVIGGIVTIAIADGMSDALGIHVSKESENLYSHKQLWQLTVMTFVAKFFMAMSFLIPVVLLPLKVAIFVSIIWGLSVLGFLSYLIARSRNANPLSAIGEHLVIAIVVIVLSYFVGLWVAATFS